MNFDAFFAFRLDDDMTKDDWRLKMTKIDLPTAQRFVNTLKNALLNEGQDGCFLPVYGSCSCWRCEARRLIFAVESGVSSGELEVKDVS